MSLSKIPYARYMLIDACITNKFKPFPSLEELRAACEEKLDIVISTSSILKDISAMKNDDRLGFFAPISFSKSQNGYYYDDPTYTIRKIALQDAEIDALKAAAEILSAYSGTRLSANFNLAVEKVFASIHEQFNSKSNRIIQTDTIVQHKGFDHFELFLNATNSCLPICFVHYSYKKRTFKTIVFHPYLLKEFQNNWYVVGFSELHQEVRTFGLDRIYEPILLKHPFQFTEAKLIEYFFENMYGVYPYEQQDVQLVEFLVDPILADFIHAHPIHKSQKREDQLHNGMAIFSLNVIPTRELVNYFLAFSTQLVVATPVWIRDEIKDTLLKSLTYGDRFFKK